MSSKACRAASRLGPKIAASVTLAAFSCAALVLLAGGAWAQQYAVSASSSHWMSTRSYAPGNVADGDPATAWAEGGAANGAGEWVRFEFEAPVRLARLGVWNGDQAEGQWDTCNRVDGLRVETAGPGGAGAFEAVLADTPGEQFVELGGGPVTSLTLTILSTHKAGNFWNRTVTCLSDVALLALPAEPRDVPRFDVAVDASEKTDVPPGREVELKPVELPDVTAPIESQSEPQSGQGAVKQAGQQAAPQSAEVGKDISLPRVELPEVGAPAGPEPEGARLARVELPDVSAPNPEADRAEAVELVRQYYLRLNTLDETFPELMASEVYDQELFSFLYFQEIQNQLGTTEKLRASRVDLSGLRIEPEDLEEATARVLAQGEYVVATPGQKLLLEENARFSLVRERGRWKILEKTDEAR